MNAATVQMSPEDAQTLIGELFNTRRRVWEWAERLGIELEARQSTCDMLDELILELTQDETENDGACKRVDAARLFESIGCIHGVPAGQICPICVPRGGAGR